MSEGRRCREDSDVQDINQFPQTRDALIRNGVEFLYMNIHTHHGMYPLYQNRFSGKTKKENVSLSGTENITTLEMYWES